MSHWVIQTYVLVELKFVLLQKNIGNDREVEIEP